MIPRFAVQKKPTLAVFLFRLTRRKINNADSSSKLLFRPAVLSRPMLRSPERLAPAKTSPFKLVQTALEKLSIILKCTAWFAITRLVVVTNIHTAALVYMLKGIRSAPVGASIALNPHTC